MSARATETGSSVLAFARIGMVCAIALVGAACQDDPKPDIHPDGIVRYPVSLAVDPKQDYAYVVSANFDRRYGGSLVAVYDLATHAPVMGAGVQIPTYAGSITLQLDATGNAVRGYVPTRDGAFLAYFDIVRDPTTGVPRLTCSTGSGAAREPGKAQPCDASHAIHSSPDGVWAVGSDPFGVAITEDGKDTWVHVTSLSEGKMALFRLDAAGVPVLESTSHFANGLHSVAVSALTGEAYVSDSFTNLIFRYNVDISAEVTPTTLPLPGHLQVKADPLVLPTGLTADYGRGLAFNHDGTVLYLAYGSPPQLLMIDTSLDALGKPHNITLASIPLGRTPSMMAIAPTGTGGSDRVYVSSLRSNDVWVVDTATRTIVDVIQVGTRPYGVAYAEVPGVGKRIYVAIFEGHTVAVIDVDPASPYFHQVIAYLR